MPGTAVAPFDQQVFSQVVPIPGFWVGGAGWV